MAQLKLTDSLKSFFEDDNKHLWKLILEDNIEELQVQLSEVHKKPKSLLEIILRELFSAGDSARMADHDFAAIEPENSALYNNLVRLLFALDINGKYEELRQKVANKLFYSLEGIVENIEKEANDYPENPITGLVWMEAEGLRSAFTNYANYYQLKEDVQSQLDVTLMRTKITLAIMGHYKNIVGPDMIESAQLMEQAGDTDTALSLYDAVISDFESEVDWFIDNPTSGASDEDAVMLESLRDCYRAMDRLNNTNKFAKKCTLIDEILSREYVEESEE